MRYILLVLAFAGCASTGQPQSMSSGAKFACGFGGGDVYRDEYGQERCRHRTAQTTHCTSRTVGDQVQTNCS